MRDKKIRRAPPGRFGMKEGTVECAPFSISLFACGLQLAFCTYYQSQSQGTGESVRFAPFRNSVTKTAQHSTAQHSTTQHSAAQHSTAQHSAAQHSTPQHSTAQRSTAQHSTAHYSSLQLNCTWLCGSTQHQRTFAKQSDTVTTELSRT